ncbi:hypothetical protein J2X69_000412 [Algoriphagus sp. 4150]|uniref:hypothetical protein n=1 Tax=Algoriphagus sp. 4150 TaxID=2817756 RepID=UPI00286284AA|nr:hypothetical protein [Algoriphagus sp. 4150]MDR7128084.1 hypothetical protein [Algoriphagus sp. 4150]
MTNAQKFLDIYNELDQSFAKALGQIKYELFSSRVRQLVLRIPVVRRYKDDLHQLGNLRNAIVHQSIKGKAIAEPYDETVSLLQRILAEY